MRRGRDYFLVLGLCSLSLAHVAHAADGDPDPSFGSQGGTTFALSSSNNDYATAVSEVAGGKLLVVGECGSVACITRLLPNGSLDSTYGFLGVGYSHFDQFATAPSHSFAAGLTVLPDGRAVVVGCTDLPVGALFMVRADGSGLDTSVGGGKGYFAGVSGSITPRFCPSSVIRQGDGKFLTTQTGQIDGFGEVILVARIAADLSGLDSSFGTNGVAELAFGLGAPGDNTDLQGGIALQNDGKVVVGGTAINQNNVPVMVFARLLPNGQRDSSFGGNGDGRLHYSGSGAQSTQINAVALQPNQRLVFAGRCYQNNTYMQMVGRLTTDGLFDPSFQGGFTAIQTPTTFAGQPSVTALAVTADSILAIGEIPRNASADTNYFDVTRLDLIGDRVISFGSSFGISYAPFAASDTNDYTQGGIVTERGIVVVGSSTSGDATEFGIARLQYQQIFGNSFE